MNQSQYIAQAVAQWILKQLDIETDMVCEGLPALDVGHFFARLAASESFHQSDFSIAIAGFSLPHSELENLARQAGLENLRSFSDDFHAAAEWRNNRQYHPRSIALASGYPAGVHTLGHYGRPHSADLAVSVLELAAEEKNQNDSIPDVHSQLLREIATNSSLGALRSLEACAAFLATWDSLIPEKGNHAPCFSLPSLGLFADPQLFEEANLGQRLELNLENVGQIKQKRMSELSKLKSVWINIVTHCDEIEFSTH